MATRAPRGYAWARRDSPASPWHLARAVPYNHSALCGVTVGQLYARQPVGETRRECALCLAKRLQRERGVQSVSDALRR